MSLVAVANSLGKAFSEVEDYTDDTTAATATDLALSALEAKRITEYNAIVALAEAVAVRDDNV